ncbi:MAG: fatty acid--CoA ligase, partial [Dyadobacter sp.]
LSQIEGVGEVAVVGLPDVRWGERPHALIVPKSGFQTILTPEIIINKMQKDVESGKIKKWYVPDQIIFVTEIPKTSVGKIDKKKIRKELSA